MADPYAGLGTPEAPEAADPYAGIGKPAPPPRKSLALGLGKGAFGPVDHYAGLLEGAIRGTSLEAPLSKLGAGLRGVIPPGLVRYLDNPQAYYDQQEAKGRVPSKVGEFGGMLAASAPTTLIPGGVLSQGATFGVLNSKADTLGGTALDAGIGAIGGKIGEKVVGSAAKAIQQATRPAIKTLREAGIRTTPGQTFGGRAMVREDKQMSRPVLGAAISKDRAAGIDQFNRAMIDLALEPLGVKVPANVKTGHDAVAFAQDAVKDAYSKVVPKLTVQVDEKLFQGMQEVAREAQMLPEAAKKIVADVTRGMGFERQGVLYGEGLQAARSELGRLARNYATSADAHQREAGRVLGWVSDHLDDALVRQNPEAAPAFKAANAAFRRQTIIDDAASRADEGVFSTGQAKQAARRADSSRRKTATARGEGPMSGLINAAREVLPAGTPNSFTADRLLEGKFIPKIQGAIGRVGYGVRSGVADAASRLPPEAANVVRRFQRPAGLFGGMAPTAATARDRRQ